MGWEVENGQHKIVDRYVTLITFVHIPNLFFFFLVENVQIFSSAIYVRWFCQCLYKRDTFLLLSLCVDNVWQSLSARNVCITEGSLLSSYGQPPPPPPLVTSSETFDLTSMWYRLLAGGMRDDLSLNPTFR